MSEKQGDGENVANCSTSSDNAGKSKLLKILDASGKPSPYERIILRDLAAINKNINDMDVTKMNRKFHWFSNHDISDIDVYKKALKKKLASIIMANADVLYKNENVVPYYVVVDFEATCEAVNPEKYQHEIIEFPAVLVNSATLEIVDTFRRICRPSLKPKLSDFCTELTGITQEEVDKADVFPVVLREFEKWTRSHDLKEFCLVTDGPWDVCKFLYVQCAISCILYPTWAASWLDIRRVFQKFYNERKCSLSTMLSVLGMSFEGRPHCGRDDAHNIARLLLRMMVDGARLLPNASLTRNSRARLDGNRDVCAMLTELAIEGERTGIGPTTNEKFLTDRDMKIERSRRLNALAKTLAIEDGDDSADGSLTEEQLKELEGIGKPRVRPKNKNRKKKFK